MVVLGGWAFLMGEGTLYLSTTSSMLYTPHTAVHNLSSTSGLSPRGEPVHHRALGIALL